jgi:PAS domain S-box-containing protein
MVGGVAFDITERKHAEEMAAFLALIVESSDDAIISKDLTGVITSWNRGAEDLYGYSAAEAVGKPISIIIPPEREEEMTEILERIKRGERIEHFETIRLTRNGERVDISLSVSPVRDSLGRIIGASKIARNITERKRGEEERDRLLEQEQQARAAAEEANRLKDEFLATISHELRTPLTAIVGWTHMLRRNQLDEKAAANALNTIERNARSQTQLIEDLLDVSRIITGKLRLDVRPFEPTSVIEAAIESLRPAAEAKAVRVQKVMDTGAGMISGDPNRLQQVVWNLLSNAIKFTPKGGRVQVRLERVNSHVEISVSDTGAGIKPEFLPFVFDRFRQADGTTTRAHGGLGLGLAIVRHLVEMHGGTVTADSPGENQGATFTVKLPLLTVHPKFVGEERVHPRASDQPLPLDCPESLEGMKVLVVDDEADTRDLLKIVLGQCGAEVVTAGSSREALELLPQVKPDVLVSDIGMPGEDGYELIRKVRALPAESGGRTPAVALTAYARTEDRLRVLRSGYQMHVPKPVEMPELVTILANLAER